VAIKNWLAPIYSFFLTGEHTKWNNRNKGYITYWICILQASL